MGSGSNLVRPLWIGGWGSIRAGKRRRPTAGGSVRGSAAPGSPELVESDGPGSNRPGFGSDGIYATRVFYWGQNRGSAGVRAALGSAAAGWRDETRRRAAFWLEKNLLAATASEKGREGGTDAHHGSELSRRAVQGVGVADRRRVAGGVRGSRCRGEVRAPGLH